MLRKKLLGAVLLAVSATIACAGTKADYVNNWLVLGLFDNDAKNTGLEKAWIDETQAAPSVGQESAGRKWTYFDDRLFSRNYDDYQDLLSFFRFKRNESVDAKVAYAHTYIFSPEEQEAVMVVGADSESKVWLNGKLVLKSEPKQWAKDSAKADVVLKEGWNRVLMKVANVENTRLGFYLGFTDRKGEPLKDVIVSVNGSEGPLAVATSGMAEIGPASMPGGWREWSYIEARPDFTEIYPPGSETDEKGWILNSFLRTGLIEGVVHSDDNTLRATAFSLQAQGGTPPYRWVLVKGELPPGLNLASNGQVKGTVSANAEIKDYAFTVRVKDAKDAEASKDLSINVKERPNRWYEESRLVCLVHAPERLTDEQIEEMMVLAKKQGYQVVMPISYNNGEMMFRWPSPFAPKGTRDVVGKLKEEIEKQGMEFGMYMGNLNLEVRPGAPFKNNQQHLMMEEAIRKYQPKSLWFDWPTWAGEAVDSLYSMIRTLDPELVIVLNGHTNASNGDWDIISFEAWGAWGYNSWGYFPVDVPWPKKGASESWRRMSRKLDVPRELKTEEDYKKMREVVSLAGPPADPDKGWEEEWKTYFKVHIAMAAEGFIANMDFSLGKSSSNHDPLKALSDADQYPYRVKMANWASPEGMPPLYPSFTQVNPGPLDQAPWGYNLINLSKDVIYLHFQKNPRGKTGLPNEATVSVGPLDGKVKSVTWMNANKPLTFTQMNTSTNKMLTIDLAGVTPDEIDTIFKIELEEPLKAPPAQAGIPAGNLATYKPSAMYGLDGKTHLIPSSGRLPKYGNDGNPETVAVGGYSWAWIYEVDLERPYAVKKVALRSGPRGFATEYEILVSLDRENWTKVADVKGIKGPSREETEIPETPTRYIRLRAVKPDGAGQIGGQMSVGELEVYE